MKTKTYQKALSLFTIISMMVMIYGFIPLPRMAGAVDSITDARDLLSDSDLSMVSNHTFTFTTGTTTPSSGYWDFDFPDEFTGVLAVNADCAYGDVNATESLVAGNIIRCTWGADQAATSSQMLITDVTNPATSTHYTIDIGNYDDNGVLLERIQVMVVIIDDVLMTATVDSTLNFTISGMNGGSTVNNINCDQTTTSTSTPFGTLVVNATTTVCQKLNVTTNADAGYTVTVEQDHELTNDMGSTINSFNNSQDGTGSTTAGQWQPPTNTIDVENTYGHMGLTSDDQDLSTGTGYNDFYNSGDALYVGLNDADPMPVMHHTGPSDGTTENIGEVNVAYSAQIASLQEAGDYESTLTYICTPTF